MLSVANSLTCTLCTSSRDWAEAPDLAWLWGIICGWDEECYVELSCRFGWTPHDVSRLTKLREQYVKIMGIKC